MTEIDTSAYVTQACTPRKILYFSCHEILEFDDLRMLSDAGHRVFSMGAYKDPSCRQFNFRRALPQFYDDELIAAYAAMGGIMETAILPDDFAKLFDVIIVNHHPEWITHNLKSKFGDVPIVLRTIGQSRRSYERDYAEMGRRINVVRYSECERDIPGFARAADVIYFAKYPSDFLPWVGGEPGLTFYNGYGLRGNTCYPIVSVWQLFNAHTLSRLYGKSNEGVDRAAGAASDGEMARLYSGAAFYFYVWSHPPSYTLSLAEAMMAGCPILAPSAKYIETTAASMTEDEAWSPARYEITKLLSEGAGIAYDTINEAVYAAHWLTHHRSSAQRMSALAASKAQERFDVRHISRQWNDLFDRIC